MYYRKPKKKNKNWLKRIIQIVTLISILLGIIYTVIKIFSPKHKNPTQTAKVVTDNSINSSGNGNIYIINSPNSNAFTSQKYLFSDSIKTSRRESSPEKQLRPTISVSNNHPGKIIIAVLPFENISNSQEYSWLSKGIAETLMKSITEIDSFVVVEGNLRDKLLAEINFQQGIYVDENSAVKIGKLIGASQVVIGSYQVFKGELDISCRIVNVESGTVEKMCLIQHSGMLEMLLQVEKDFAQKVLICLKK